ncbi:thiol peroxidase [Corynebacterium sp. HS2168-gen11]|uniref:thiol peroxidase n=1 Tax=Corynebacterium sp. HS2168-gen11 TaxID=2974027 RepID=UPI00216AF43E|nr:thiol peroxidase [Corynebacterium sp. HS2168-gen11]MCS4535186.1 thiol peroxidase [Corynebacterium sp. HS2168-gen11]
MAQTLFRGTPVTTVGELPTVGSKLPDFRLVGTDMSEISLEQFAGKNIVLNIFPSVDTGICAQSVRHFNQLAASLENTVVVCVSADLPFAHARFCGAEGIDAVISASSFRSDFGQQYGLTLEGSPIKGLLSRSVIVADATGTIQHVELVPEIGTEPNYDAALAVLS